MVRRLIIVLITFVLLGNSGYSKTIDSLRYSIGIGYGVDLFDSYWGNDPGRKTPELPLYYSTILNVSKGWYGVNMYYGIYKSTYNNIKEDNSIEFKIPDMVEGTISGINGVIYPIDNKYLKFALEAGVSYTNLNSLKCSSWQYSVINGVPMLHNARYRLYTDSGFGFSYGASLDVRIYKSLYFNPYFRTSKRETGSSFIVGLSLNYSINK